MSIYRPSIRLSIFIIISIVVAACVSNNDKADQALKHQFNVVDSLILAGKSDSAVSILRKLRPQIKADNPLICTYYSLIAEYSHNQVAQMQLYADSAMAFFSDSGKIKKYPDQYIKALLIKGDVNIMFKKYDTALDYYYQRKKVLSNSGCDDGNLAGKIANIYYQQKNYKLAAQCQAQAYKQIQDCAGSMSQQKLFFISQGELDNTAIAYERAGMTDSARYYYNEDLKVINAAEKGKVIDQYYTNSAKEVLYDNLGGLSLRIGDLAQAEKYLLECVNIPNKEVDGARIPPFLKLAQIYLKTKRYNKAVDAFKQSRRLLDKFSKDNPDSEIAWNKLYAEYLFDMHDLAKAYAYQNIYLHLKDSVDNSVATLYRFDVDHELKAIQQQQILAEVKHQDSVKLFYLIGISIAGLLLLTIIVLINRNLNQSRKNHKLTSLHNEQLQTTLAELERANKNYIRIMRVMAHDLRNPLSGMIGLATVLLDEDDFSEDSKHMLRLIETTGIHSIEMISELLKSGLADENEVIAKQNLDLQALLQDSVELLQFKANEKNQQIVFEGGEEPIMVDVNHEKIWRVFNNLIVNAIKFSYQDGTIKAGIKISKDKKHVVVWVADNGMGIPEKDKDSIFEMFTAAKKTGTNGEQPFGLGLSISKKIIEKHNGRIWFESTPGAGTVFYIELPR